MTDDTRKMLHEMAEDLWRAFRWMSALEVPDSGNTNGIARLQDDRQIRDLMTRYAYSHDAKDVDWSMTLFTNDCISGRLGTDRVAVGKNAVTALFYEWNAFHKFSRHRITNQIVRFINSDEAWLSAYWQAARTGHAGEVASLFGRYLWRVVRQDGQWLIADRINSVDFGSGFADDATTVAPPKSHALGATQGASPVWSKKRVAADGGREAFLKLADDMWTAWRWVLDVEHLASDDGLAPIRLGDELHIRELLANYAYAFDSQDLDWCRSLFTSDAILLNSSVIRGRSETVEALRSPADVFKRVHHRFSNPIVRLMPGSNEAWLTAYLQVLQVEHTDQQHALFKRVLGRLTKASGRWQIAGWNMTIDARLRLEPSFAARSLRKLDAPAPPEK